VILVVPASFIAIEAFDENWSLSSILYQLFGLGLFNTARIWYCYGRYSMFVILFEDGESRNIYQNFEEIRMYRT